MRFKALAALTFLAGCASTGQAAQSYVGKPVDNLVKAWGPPVQSEALASGGRVLQYADKRSHTVSGQEPITYVCEMNFTADASGTITGVTVAGQC